MDIFQICIVGVIGATLALAVKNSRPEIAVVISIATGVVLFVMLTVHMSAFVSEIKATLDKYNVPQAYLTTVIKVMGISYIAEFSSQVCKDAGESATASKILIGGRVLIACLTVPIMRAIVEKICGVLI